MGRHKIVLITGIMALAAGMFLSSLQLPVRYPVYHQHREAVQDQPEITGFGADGSLTTHLPVMILHTKGREIPGVNGKSEEKLLCRYEILQEEEGLNHTDDPAAQSGFLAISIRGNSSRIFPKKQYAIRTQNEEGLLGMPPGTGWVLNGSYIDRGMIRNYMLCNLAGEIMPYAPRVRLCEVFLETDRGSLQYQGVYTLMEKPKVSPFRLNLPPYDPGYRETSFLLLMNGSIDKPEIPHLKPDTLTVLPSELLYPGEEDISESSLEYVKEQLLKAEKALYDGSMTGNWENVSKMLDLASFADYYILNEFFQNYDAGTRSTYLYQGLGGKLAIGPVWDFDGTFNNFAHATLRQDLLELKTTFYYCYLVKCPEFIELCTRRYPELRNSILKQSNLIAYIEESAAYLGTAAKRNCDRWYGHDLSEFERDIQKMKDFVIQRGNFMDRMFLQKSRIIQ